MSKTRCLLALTAALGALLVAPSWSSARMVRRCEVVIKENQVGVLAKHVGCGWRCNSDPSVRCQLVRQDFRCPLDDSPNCRPERIVLERNATLELNGFDLTAAYHGDSPLLCRGDRRGTCTLQGPGDLNAGKEAAVSIEGRHDLQLRDVTLSQAYRTTVTEGRVRASRVTLLDPALVVGRAGVRAAALTIGTGAWLDSGGNLFLDGGVVRGGLSATRILRAKDIDAGDDRGYVAGNDVYLLRARFGTGRVHAERRLELRDSDVGEVESGEKPRLVRSTCARSRKLGTSESWGVCTGD